MVKKEARAERRDEGWSARDWVGEEVGVEHERRWGRRRGGVYTVGTMNRAPTSGEIVGLAGMGRSMVRVYVWKGTDRKTRHYNGRASG